MPVTDVLDGDAARRARVTPQHRRHLMRGGVHIVRRHLGRGDHAEDLERRRGRRRGHGNRPGGVGVDHKLDASSELQRRADRGAERATQLLRRAQWLCPADVGGERGSEHQPGQGVELERESVDQPVRAGPGPGIGLVLTRHRTALHDIRQRSHPCVECRTQVAIPHRRQCGHRRVRLIQQSLGPRRGIVDGRAEHSLKIAASDALGGRARQRQQQPQTQR
ncbi:hypothetical protein HGK72_12235 [Mycolicibacterium fortuitum]|uniref:hypothetical protein n=1 Tax=Mycolicibacterium fortuitum TaxID=1766 RepID=UPI00148FFD31|nr:hypothetical protein [Mycolicibacterium fortuitum]